MEQEERRVKQVRYIAEDYMLKSRLGILMENGDMICCDSGRILKASDHGKTWEIVLECEGWDAIDMSEDDKEAKKAYIEEILYSRKTPYTKDELEKKDMKGIMEIINQYFR